MPRIINMRGLSWNIKLIKLVLFDCDGVLVDSEILAAQISAEMFRSIGLEMSVDDVVTNFVGLDAKAAKLRAEALFGISMSADYDAALHARMDDAFTTRLLPITGVQSVLENLKLPFCVASNSGHERLKITFAATHLSALVGGRIFSADDVVRGKPAPDLFLHAAEKMGNFHADECLVIEDSVTGVTAAMAAGMRVIGFCGGGHIRDGHAEKLLSLGAEAIITDYSQLYEHPLLTHAFTTAALSAVDA